MKWIPTARFVPQVERGVLIRNPAGGRSTSYMLAMRNDVGTPVAIISQLNTQPACAPVNASPTALQLPTHDSGSGWLATPFLCDSFIHNSTPVYPGALRNLLDKIMDEMLKLNEIIIYRLKGGSAQ